MKNVILNKLNVKKKTFAIGLRAITDIGIFSKRSEKNELLISSKLFRRNAFFD